MPRLVSRYAVENRPLPLPYIPLSYPRMLPVALRVERSALEEIYAHDGRGMGSGVDMREEKEELRCCPVFGVGEIGKAADRTIDP